MEYHNGIIIILQSGWYTCTANTLGKTSNEMISLHIALEDELKSCANSHGATTATTTFSGYFNQLDLVQVRKAGGSSVGHVHDDWFECRMIP